MTVGVVIPCRNEAHWIVEVLDALRVQDRQPDDVVIVDDGSIDETARVVEQWRRAHPDQPVRLIEGPGHGVAAAVNAGIAALRTEVIVRLDGHCRPELDYVRRTSTLATQDGVGVAGGAWTIKASAASLEAVAIAIAVSHPLGSGGAAYRHAVERQTSNVELHTSDGRDMPPAPSLEPQARVLSVDTVPFGCFRRTLWESLRGLDERLGSNEDYDFNFRVRKHGLSVMLDPSIHCTYYARPDIRTLARQYGRYGWWKARMLRHHPGSIRWRQLIPALLVPGLILAAIGVTVRPERIWLLLLALYPLTVLAGAMHAAARSHNWGAAGWLFAAFSTIHVTWSGGFWGSVLSMVTEGKDRGAAA